jgi:hypothetical protein
VGCSYTLSDGISIWGGSYNVISGNEVFETGWNAIHIESRSNVGRPANYNIVERNFIHDNDAHYGINIIPETAGTQDILYGNVVRYNVVHRCGLFTRKGVDAEIYGNIFYDDGLGENNGIWFDVLSGSHSTPSNTKVYNNTFVTSAETYAIYNVTNKDLDIKNNIVYQEYPAALMYMGNTAGHDIDYNLYYSTETNYAVRWGGSNKTLPQFQAMGYEAHGFWDAPLLNEDFTLTGNSPAIGAGVDLGEPYNVDMFGNVQTGAWDMGALIYTGVVPVLLWIDYEIFGNGIELTWDVEPDTPTGVERSINTPNNFIGLGLKAPGDESFYDKTIFLGFPVHTVYYRLLMGSGNNISDTLMIEL